MTGPTLLDVLAAELSGADDDKLERLAPLIDRLAERVAERLDQEAAKPDAAASAWLNARQAADYLGLSLTALHKHTAARTIPFEQDAPGCKLWFRRDKLDAWRTGEWSSVNARCATTLPKRFQSNPAVSRLPR